MTCYDIDKVVAELHGREDVVLLDVRTPDEYAAGHIPGSINCPLERLQMWDGDADIPIYAYCRSGARSERATLLLRELGYTAFNIGGIMDYHGPLAQ